ncbi:MAG: thiol:disulfide interchange protein DsbA/DsbL [Cocleimonas sp.]|nr:thiol:disulfide interchange protein DsbA/DsbL [Cocleimonas sp.]
MKLQCFTNKPLPKLSTSLVALSLFVLVACNESTATAEQVPAGVKENVQKTEVIATTAANTVEDKKIVLADASQASNTNNTAVVKKSAPKFIEGKHYFEIFPQINTDAPAGKVEVLELMWLGCPHCYHLEEHVKNYKKTMADYIEFKQIPAMLNPSWAKDAEMFYIAELLDPKGNKQLINKIFHAIHEQGRRFTNEGSIKRYFSQLGINEAQYNSTKNSMAYKAKLNRARQIGAASQISSVPSFIINGKYRTSPYTAGSEEKLFQLIEMLTKQEKK